MTKLISICSLAFLLGTLVVNASKSSSSWSTDNVDDEGLAKQLKSAAPDEIFSLVMENPDSIGECKFPSFLYTALHTIYMEALAAGNVPLIRLLLTHTKYKAASADLINAAIKDDLKMMVALGEGPEGSSLLSMCMQSLSGVPRFPYLPLIVEDVCGFEVIQEAFNMWTPPCAVQFGFFKVWYTGGTEMMYSEELVQNGTCPIDGEDRKMLQSMESIKLHCLKIIQFGKEESFTECLTVEDSEETFFLAVRTARVNGALPLIKQALELLFKKQADGFGHLTMMTLNNALFAAIQLGCLETFTLCHVILKQILGPSLINRSEAEEACGENKYFSRNIGALEMIAEEVNSKGCALVAKLVNAYAGSLLACSLVSCSDIWPLLEDSIVQGVFAWLKDKISEIPGRKESAMVYL